MNIQEKFIKEICINCIAECDHGIRVFDYDNTLYAKCVDYIRNKGGKEMNIQGNINKLLSALKQKGQLYKINSFLFYNEKNDKYSTKYQVMKKELVEEYNLETEEIEYQERYTKKYECYSKVDLMKYLVKEYEKGSEVDGRK